MTRSTPEASYPPGTPADNSRQIHDWFELSYAQYLTIPRSVLQSMPDEWQARFVRCLDELDDAIDWRPSAGLRYRVQLYQETESYDGGEYVRGWGRPVRDPLADYQRGRRRIPTREATR